MKASNIQKQENRKKAESLDVYRDSRIPSPRTWERPDELLLISFSPEVFSACLPTGGAVPSVLLLTFALLGVFCSYLEKSLLVPSKHLQHSCFLGRQET